MIDHYIEAFSSVPLKKMKPVIRNTLRLSVYQMKFMDSVPVHSCIDEAVKLTRKRGFNNLTGFVNGVLRAISRDAGTLYLPQNVRASAPLWIYDMITEQYGEDAAKEFFRAAGEKKKGICVRFCRIRANDEAILKMLAEENVSAEKISDILGTYIIYGFESLNIWRRDFPVPRLFPEIFPKTRLQRYEKMPKDWGSII